MTLIPIRDRLARLTRRAWLAVAICGIASAVYALARWQMYSTARATVYVSLALSVAAGSIAIVKLSPTHQLRLLIMLASIALPAYAFESYLEATHVPFGNLAEAAARAGVPFDTRTISEVCSEFRAGGEDAVPVVYPSQHLAVKDPELFPLSGIACARTVFGNESESYVIYTSDEHGFNNPPGSRDAHRRLVRSGGVRASGE